MSIRITSPCASSQARPLAPGLVAALVAVAAVLMPSLSFADEKAKAEFVHEANVMGKLGNHPNVIHFIGAFTADVAIVPSADGRGNNPLYEGQTGHGTNPIYDGAAPPDTPPGVHTVTFTLDNLGLAPSANGEGVVHRDIAARNFIVTTNNGTYASSPDQFLLFGNDGGPIVQGTHDKGVGPIRWMAPESLRLLSATPPSIPPAPDDYFDILAGSSFTTNYLPEPGVLGAFGALALTALRRRR